MRGFRVTTWSAGALLVLLAAANLAAQSTTVILVRHAEKAATPDDDPPLTLIGTARAKALWEALKDAGVDAIITTQYARTRATAEPTASALRLTPEVINAPGANHVQDVAAAIRTHAGHTVLVVGHSNTVPFIIEALGAAKPPAICDLEYDNLYIVTLGPSGRPGVVHSKFGERTVDMLCTK